MQHGKPASASDREQFPKLQESIGEDPARWLDRDLVTPGATRIDVRHGKARLFPDRDVSSAATFVRARIRGIDRIEVCRAWKAVERALGRGPDDGPREQVIAMLEKREQELEVIGERPDRLEHGPRLPPSWTTTESVAVWTDTEDGTRPTMAGLGSRRDRSAARTDGGER